MGDSEITGEPSNAYSQNDDKSEKTVKERAGYVQLLFNDEGLDQNVRYFIAPEGETDEKERNTRLQPCLCYKCHRIIDADEQIMGEHCEECQVPEKLEFMYGCKKCGFRVDTQFEACLHYLEDGSCEGEIELFRKTNEEDSGKSVWDFATLVRRYCTVCELDDMECNRSVDGTVCKICGTKLTVVCTKCRGLFKNYSQAKNHVKTKCEPVKHVCEVCGFDTPTKGTLKEHKRRLHSNHKSCVCKYCGFATNDRKAMSKHLRTQHEPHQYCECESCSHCTQDEESLLRHVAMCSAAKKKKED